MVKLYISIFILFLTSAQALATKPGQLSLVEKLQQTKEKVLQNDKKERNVLNRLFNVEKRIKRLVKKRSINENRMYSAEGNVKKVARQIVSLKRIIKSKRGQLGSRLKAMYMFQNLGALRILLNSKMGDVDKNVKYLKNISQADIKLISTYLHDLQKLKKKELIMQKKVKILMLAQDKLRASEQNLVSEQRNKKKILNIIKVLKNKNVESLGKIKEKLKTKYKVDFSSLKIYKEAFFEKKGRLKWPVFGKVKKSYGLIYNYEYNYKLKRNGVSILPEEDQQVSVVASGTVTFVGEISGYGISSIVEHGDNYFTVYSGLANVVVDTGQQLAEGDIISENLANAGENGLYFEVRHFSESVDPEKWLGKEILVGKTNNKKTQLQ